jgi:predicted house-cleaning NTP pyrophosphatase (Maf/HAM1 superfamily)
MWMKRRLKASRRESMSFGWHKAKALAIQPKAESDAVIVGSDTTVVDGNEILGKPVDEQDAERMLKQLRGRTHQVFTGVAILRASDGTMFTELSITDVPMRNYSDDEIAHTSKQATQWTRLARMPFNIPNSSPLNPCRDVMPV